MFAVPKIWRGTVVILGGGPSLIADDVQLVRKARAEGLCRVIGVNNAYTFGEWIDLCWFGDSMWFGWHHRMLRKFPGLKFHCDGRLWKVQWIKYVHRSNKTTGIDVDPRYVAWNGNSGGSAVNLAYHLGAKHVVLLGFDMEQVNGRHNWHNDHKVVPNKDIYKEKFLPAFGRIAKDAKRLGLRITNATRGGRLDMFERIPIQEVLK